MRMLMNNLDPEVAERPDDLVVYGGTGRAARSWEAFDAIVRTLRALADDETLLVQSGKPVGVFRTHEWAPRVLIANSNLVPEWANWDEFRRLEALGLTMYGQMTAGSWIYIGTQGIVQGTYECFAEIARRRYGGSLAGTITAHRRARRHGRRAAAGGDDERRRRAVRRGRPRAHRAPARDALPRRGGRRPRRRGRPLPRRARRSDVRCPSASRATRPTSCRRCSRAGFEADIVTDQTSAHDPLTATSRTGCRSRRPTSCARATPRSTSAARVRRWPPTARRWSASSTPAARSSTTATACAPRRGSAASSARSTTPASSRPTSGRCSARARARSAGSALSGDPADIAATDRAVLDEFPDDEPLARWIQHASERIAFQGLPARICWLGYGERAPPRPALQRDGALRASSARRS